MVGFIIGEHILAGKHCVYYLVITTIWYYYYHTHFTDEETETERIHEPKVTQPVNSDWDLNPKWVLLPTTMHTVVADQWARWDQKIWTKKSAWRHWNAVRAGRNWEAKIQREDAPKGKPDLLVASFHSGLRQGICGEVSRILAIWWA